MQIICAYNATQKVLTAIAPWIWKIQRPQTTYFKPGCPTFQIMCWPSCVIHFWKPINVSVILMYNSSHLSDVRSAQTYLGTVRLKRQLYLKVCRMVWVKLTYVTEKRNWQAYLTSSDERKSILPSSCPVSNTQDWRSKTINAHLQGSAEYKVLH